MENGLGRPWTDFLPPENVTHEQPLHWRLLDGTRVTMKGTARPWRVTLIPRLQPGFDPTGFELLLLSDEQPMGPVEDPETIDSERTCVVEGKSGERQVEA